MSLRSILMAATCCGVSVLAAYHWGWWGVLVGAAVSGLSGVLAADLDEHFGPPH